ncbi:UNKNOWN [Stylonychia lemnae]|uniref:Uncharacterized protein n=1 Tax=Stylonychia lemnae TaxID=5949 RepID=A0A078BCH5_STYLE|nr:UNKNOWN [Stylonychia lemnae]|eukprot:CDW91313.1 UNKNOWN [Stylonychia lemnae]
MKSNDIQVTLQKRKFFVEKRKLENHELQFFLQAAAERKSKVQHGAQLQQVLSDQQHINQQPLKLMETALPEQLKQYPDPQPINPEKMATQYTLPRIQSGINRHQSREDLHTAEFKNSVIETLQNNNYHILQEYVRDSKFNPIKEISKEKNITQFFVQKEMLINNYLDDEEQEVKAYVSTVKTQFMKKNNQTKKNNKKKQAQSLIESDMEKPKLMLRQKKTRAEEFVDQISKQINGQLDQIFERQRQADDEEYRFKQDIDQIKSNQSRRIQNFVDPRATKIRKNFRVINEKLDEIRKLDPHLQTLQKIQTRLKMVTTGAQGRASQRDLQSQMTYSDAPQNIFRSQSRIGLGGTMMKSKSNAVILNEILNVGRDSFTHKY